MHLSSNIYLVGGEDPLRFNARTYLIQGEQNFLIDCGSLEGLPALSYNLAKHGLSFRDIEMIIGTHCHRDHVQASSVLSTPIWLHHRGVEPVIQGDPSLTGAYLFHKPFYPLTITNVIDGYAGDNEILDDGSTMEFIHTPGHSPDSCCILYRPIDGPNVLFAGDTVWGGFSHKIKSDLKEWKKSLEKILELDFELLLPGHCSERHLPQTKHHLKKAVANFGKELRPDFGDLLSPWE